VALGSVTNFHGLPGLEQHAVTMKTLGDAIHLRNRVIAHLEEADGEETAERRSHLLTIVVAGGGFAGVETAASLYDFVLESLRFYRNVSEADVRMIIVHSGATVLPELGPELGAYAQLKLSQRGIQIITGTRVVRVNQQGVTLGSGLQVPTSLVVWTAGTSPNPLLKDVTPELSAGRLMVNEYLEVPGWSACGRLAIARPCRTCAQDSCSRPRPNMPCGRGGWPHGMCARRSVVDRRYPSSSVASGSSQQSASAREWPESSASASRGSRPGGSGALCT